MPVETVRVIRQGDGNVTGTWDLSRGTLPGGVLSPVRVEKRELSHMVSMEDSFRKKDLLPPSFQGQESLSWGLGI